MTDFNQLMGVADLAKALRRSRTYIWGMRRAGFPMPGGRATPQNALDWLRENPDFRVNRPIVNARERA